jgi:hypothetical protein
LIGGVRVNGDSAVGRVTTYEDSPAHGIHSRTESWMFQRSGSGWRKVGIKRGETLWVG